MKTDRKDTTTELHFQEAFSAIFLKNRKIKSGRFSTKSDKVWAESLQIRHKTGFWRSRRTEVMKSEFFGEKWCGYRIWHWRHGAVLMGQKNPPHSFDAGDFGFYMEARCFAPSYSSVFRVVDATDAVTRGTGGRHNFDSAAR